jgi:hypothetical protein
VPVISKQADARLWFLNLKERLRIEHKAPSHGFEYNVGVQSGTCG